MSVKRSFPRTQNLLLSVQFAGDVAVCFSGLSLGFFLRFHSPLRRIGIEATESDYATYTPLLVLGTLLLIGGFAFLRLYDARLLLRPHRAWLLILRGTFFWLLLFLSVSLILKFEPAISRIFVATSCLTTLAMMLGWRFLFYEALSRSEWRDRIMQRIAVIGWSEEAARLVEAIRTDQNHPYDVYGVVSTATSATPAGASERCLGSFEALDDVLARHLVDIAVVADLDLTRNQLLAAASICERRYVDFKVIPSFFQIFVSNLRMQTVSGVPLLGVERIPLHNLLNRFVKRTVDILGSLVGLVVSLPIMGVLAALVRRESPGPVIYPQVRTGLHGGTFTIYKLRSMRIDAEKDSGPAWAVEGDARRLKIGAFMREWNLDELPQFWNVLIGDMSLVGPRPERPELIAQFEEEVPHYNPRHEVRPGITGWAQVNGLRGNTSLEERIRYDLYYIENWSLWFDLQIMLLTFTRRQNAY